MTGQNTVSRTPTIDWLREADKWNPSWDELYDWDPDWAEQCLRMCMNPWTSGILPLKTIELICIGLNAACTNLQPAGTRRHIHAALEAGATRDEILLVLKMASVMSIHSCSLGAPILLEEAKAVSHHRVGQSCGGTISIGRSRGRVATACKVGRKSVGRQDCARYAVSSSRDPPAELEKVQTEAHDPQNTA